jgi:hypothetical protein
MRTETEIIDALEMIKKKDVLNQPTATIEENAPLALMQLAWESWVKALKWVLAESRGDGKEDK